jgi:heterodisulfide reductase subunit A-like polyferredoxin
MLASFITLAAATAADCRTEPLSAKQAANLTACKVLIVGAGPGGLYSAYFLRELGKDLCIVEKKQELGGELHLLDSMLCDVLLLFPNHMLAVIKHHQLQVLLCDPVQSRMSDWSVVRPVAAANCR